MIEVNKMANYNYIARYIESSVTDGLLRKMVFLPSGYSRVRHRAAIF